MQKKHEVNRLQKLLNCCLRTCVPSNVPLSNAVLHNRARLLPLHLRHRCSLLKQMYRCARDPRYTSPQNLRKGRSQDCTDIRTHFPKNEFYRKCPFFERPRFWRSLPKEVKNAENVEIFRKQLFQLTLAEF